MSWKPILHKDPKTCFDFWKYKKEKQAQIFIETPYRNDSIIKDLCKFLNPNTKICIASDLSLSTEFISTKLSKDWKSTNIKFNKRPTIFIIEAP